MRRALVKRWYYVKPTEKAISDRLGGRRVRLRVSGPIAAAAWRDPTRVEAGVRRWYEANIETHLRRITDLIMRVYWTARTPLDVSLSMVRPAAPARIRLKIWDLHLTPEQQQLVSSIVSAKLPTGELTEHWNQHGWRVRAVWRARQRPPARAGYAELVAAFARLTEHEFYIGPTAGGGQLVIDLDDDSPHVGLSAGTGAGKTVAAMLLAVQNLHRGGYVTIIDRKGSHRWARKLPGVTYCMDVADMHNRLIELAAVADRRNREAFDQPDGWDPGPRHMVLFEELNATLGMLRDHWDAVRPGLAAQAKLDGAEPPPKASPAIKAAKDILFMGRSAKVNMVAIAQLLSALAIGGPEARENLGIRGLARFTRNAWKMLAGDVRMPRPSRTRGRWHFVIGGEVTEVQVVYLKVKQARAFAVVTDSPRGSDSASTSTVTDDRDSGRPQQPRITLQEAIDEHLLPWQPDAVRQRLSRARRAGRWAPPTYGRRGRADLYLADDLIRWVALEQREDVDA